MPPALQTEPALLPGLDEYTEAFILLSPSRQITFGGEAAIPISEIAAYCGLVGTRDIDAMLRLISAMDEAYLKHVNGEGDNAH